MSLPLARALNERCWCVGTDLPGLRQHVDELLVRAGIGRASIESHPHLFAAVPVFIAQAERERIEETVRAIHRVTSLPAWRVAALGMAGELAPSGAGNSGEFLGVDFHLEAHGGAGAARLIEINTNPGGALLNTLLGRAQQTCCEPVAAAFPDLQNFAAAETALVDLFVREWQAAGRSGQPGHVVICDDDPSAQYLYPEFLLYRAAFEARGIACSIADPRSLVIDASGVSFAGRPIDLIYNRLTDFALRAEHLQSLRAAWESHRVVLTPHPNAHAWFADKRNLVQLADAAALQAMGVDVRTREVLAEAVPPSRLVAARDADELWRERKRYFFKPLDGFGGRGAYRGDKLTRRVFDDILLGGYIAQRVVPPSERVVADDAESPLKVDVRAYAYEGEVLLLAARLYRGQTTNFRTPGGGFAPVLRAVDGCGCAA